MKNAGDRKLVLDACVLIDYLQEDERILSLIAQGLGSIIVPSPVLLEVSRLTAATCDELGLAVFDPGVQTITDAAKRGGALSVQDRICLSVAQQLEATLYSNDKPMIRAAQAAGLDVRWGLELILELTEIGSISQLDAQGIGGRICGRSNHKAEVLSQFNDALSEVLARLI
jgi:predicted nucleic acid-binding protein